MSLPQNYHRFLINAANPHLMEMDEAWVRNDGESEEKG